MYFNHMHTHPIAITIYVTVARAHMQAQIVAHSYSCTFTHIHRETQRHNHKVTQVTTHKTNTHPYIHYFTSTDPDRYQQTVCVKNKMNQTNIYFLSHLSASN